MLRGTHQELSGLFVGVIGGDQSSYGLGSAAPRRGLTRARSVPGWAHENVRLARLSVRG